MANTAPPDVNRPIKINRSAIPAPSGGNLNKLAKPALSGGTYEQHNSENSIINGDLHPEGHPPTGPDEGKVNVQGDPRDTSDTSDHSAEEGKGEPDETDEHNEEGKQSPTGASDEVDAMEVDNDNPVAIAQAASVMTTPPRDHEARRRQGQQRRQQQQQQEQQQQQQQEQEQQQEESKQLTCAVCGTGFVNNSHKLSCGHNVHSWCIVKRFQNNELKCPCGKNVKDEDFYNVTNHAPYEEKQQYAREGYERAAKKLPTVEFKVDLKLEEEESPAELTTKASIVKAYCGLEKGYRSIKKYNGARLVGWHTTPLIATAIRRMYDYDTKVKNSPGLVNATDRNLNKLDRQLVELSKREQANKCLVDLEQSARDIDEAAIQREVETKMGRKRKETDQFETKAHKRAVNGLKIPGFHYDV